MQGVNSVQKIISSDLHTFLLYICTVQINFLVLSLEKCTGYEASKCECSRQKNSGAESPSDPQEKNAQVDQNIYIYIYAPYSTMDAIITCSSVYVFMN
jgi:hypothetical protein